MLGAIIESVLSVYLLAVSAVPSSEHLTRFESTDGFSVLYPANWTRLGVDTGTGGSTTRLDVVSATPRVQGVVIGRGQAEIVVRKLTEQDEAFANQLERGHVGEEVVINLRNLPTHDEPQRDCSDPVEVTSRVEEGPGAFTINTWLMCTIRNERFLILIRYWEGERRSREFRLIAGAVAASIRTVIRRPA